MTDTPRKRRGSVPFSERLAEANGRVRRALVKWEEACADRDALVAREREKVRLLQDALPPEPKAESV